MFFFRFVTQFTSIIRKSSANLQVTNNSMDATLLNIAKKSLREYNFQYLTGANVAPNGTIFTWFNNQAIHSAALALDLVHKALIKLYLGDEYSIEVTNAPLKFQPRNDTNPELKDVDSFGYSFSMGIGLVMSILSASYISFYIKVLI